MKRNETAFRKSYLTAFSTVAIMGVVAAFPYVVYVQQKAYWQAYFAAPIFVAFGYLFWLVGWHSAIRLNDDALIVDNVFLRHSMPLNGASVRVEEGLYIIAADGTKVGSVSFGGSAIASYRYTRRVADKINAEIGRRVATGGVSDDLVAHTAKICVPWKPVLGFLALFEAAAFVVSLFR